MNKLNAFQIYLVKLPINEAIDHVEECLVEGPNEDNEAFNLLMETYGSNWTATSRIGLRSLISGVIINLKGKYDKSL